MNGIKTDVDAGAAFSGRAPARRDEEQTPERIRKDAPRPVLRPGGGWAAQADAVDRQVREAEDAAKAKRSWAEEVKAQRRQKSLSRAFGGDE